MNHVYTVSQNCDRCGMSQKALLESKSLRHIKIMRTKSVTSIFVGPFQAAFSLGPGSFAWREGDGPITRWLRRYWSGWHRWDWCL